MGTSGLECRLCDILYPRQLAPHRHVTPIEGGVTALNSPLANAMKVAQRKATDPTASRGTRTAGLHLASRLGLSFIASGTL